MYKGLSTMYILRSHDSKEGGGGLFTSPYERTRARGDLRLPRSCERNMYTAPTASGKGALQSLAISSFCHLNKTKGQRPTKWI